MLGQFEDFFVELAQVFKKHKVTAPFGCRFPVSFTDTEQSRVIGMYKITEVWINKEGEAVIRVKNDDHSFVGTKREYEIYSDGKVS